MPKSVYAGLFVNVTLYKSFQLIVISRNKKYEGWNFNSGNYLFTTNTK